MDGSLLRRRKVSALSVTGVPAVDLPSKRPPANVRCASGIVLVVDDRQRILLERPAPAGEEIARAAAFRRDRAFVLRLQRPVKFMPQTGALGAASIQRPAMSIFGAGAASGVAPNETWPAQARKRQCRKSAPSRAELAASRGVVLTSSSGSTNSAPSLVPVGQREVTVLVLV